MRAATALAAAALALSGCPFHPREPVPLTTEGDWSAKRDVATRRSFLYDGIDHKATATATLLSLDVRVARARRLAMWQGWSAQELEQKLAQERATAAQAEEFLVVFYTSNPTWNDLDAPRSVWRISAKAGDEELVANHVTSVDMDATLKGLFPFIGVFDVAYVVTMPRAPSGELAGRPFTLDLSSALGRVTLDWSVSDGKPIEKPVTPGP